MCKTDGISLQDYEILPTHSSDKNNVVITEIGVLNGCFCSRLRSLIPHFHHFREKLINKSPIHFYLPSRWLTETFGRFCLFFVFCFSKGLLPFWSTQLHIWSSCPRPTNPGSEYCLSAQSVSLASKVTVETGQGLSTHEGTLTACAVCFLFSALRSRCADRRI